MCFRNLLLTSPILIAVVDEATGHTATYCIFEDNKMIVCEYSIHRGEPTESQEKKVVLQQNNLLSSLEFWQDVHLPNLAIMTDLPFQDFTRSIRVINHELKLKGQRINPMFQLQIYEFPDSLHIETQQQVPVSEVYQRAARALCRGDTQGFKELLINSTINIQAFRRIVQ